MKRKRAALFLAIFFIPVSALAVDFINPPADYNKKRVLSNKDYEHCFDLNVNQEIGFHFKSLDPIDFNIHYHPDDFLHRYHFVLPGNNSQLSWKSF